MVNAFVTVMHLFSCRTSTDLGMSGASSQTYRLREDLHNRETRMVGNLLQERIIYC